MENRSERNDPGPIVSGSYIDESTFTEEDVANYFKGEPKCWYSVPSNEAIAFEKVGPAPALNKAEVPWSARRGTFSSKDHALKTVKGILNKPTPKKFDLLKRQLIDSGITTADILKNRKRLKALTAKIISSISCLADTHEIYPWANSLVLSLLLLNDTEYAIFCFTFKKKTHQA